MSLTLFLRYLDILKERNLLNLEILRKNEDIIIAKKSEREQLLIDLHDRFTNSLLSLKYTFKHEYSNDKTIKNIDNLLVELAKFIHQYEDINFDKISLIDSIIFLTNKFKKITKINFEFQIIGESKVLLNVYNLNIYKIILETINNVLKHSNANIVLIEITYHSKELIIIISDNGQNSLKAREIIFGIGLTSIKKRVEILNGSVSFDLTENGFLTSIIIPIREIA
jgi:signal transduction histidine kinase